ncbi:MAG: 16S rRNA (cytidine(1402)-2'-O)-methyltransferase [Candidatus Fervidibacter sp.]|uniref:16S rRNA (cytidine(1402)-2'-O)-methyltransferase n=1 Tax=Candidatus Fervidibacter sp. TaxID=3100871 RepID=UPI00404B027D
MEHSCGTLYVCATPIGNMGDITLRALEVLKSVDLIAAEDTRVALKLLNHYGIKKPLVSYHQHSPQSRLDWLLRQLKSGRNVALVCNAGTPGVSDPGVPLVRRALQEKIPVAAVPGASAVIAALSVSGMDAQRFVFLGFLPRERKGRRELFEMVKFLPFTLVVYEAPHRLKKSLKDMLEVLGDRQVVLCRELTKLHEEVTLTTLSALTDRYEKETPLGEFTIVIEGAKQTLSGTDWTAIDEMLETLLKEGRSVSSVAKEVAQKFGVPRSTLYRRALKLQRLSRES